MHVFHSWSHAYADLYVCQISQYFVAPQTSLEVDWRLSCIWKFNDNIVNKVLQFYNNIKQPFNIRLEQTNIYCNWDREGNLSDISDIILESVITIVFDSIRLLLNISISVVKSITLETLYYCTFHKVRNL